MIEVIARTLVDLPDQVSVKEVVGENTTVIELRVAKSDIGKIIGKEGKTAKAIRTLLLGAATKVKRRTVLEIVE
ncbi:KH domain-containing protein [bacterium]|nr:KH domain-containing protein [bacterium]